MGGNFINILTEDSGATGTTSEAEVFQCPALTAPAGVQSSAD
jgi:hypothetical protein